MGTLSGLGSSNPYSVPYSTLSVLCWTRNSVLTARHSSPHVRSPRASPHSSCYLVKLLIRFPCFHLDRLLIPLSLISLLDLVLPCYIHSCIFSSCLVWLQSYWCTSWSLLLCSGVYPAITSPTEEFALWS